MEKCTHCGETRALTCPCEICQRVSYCSELCREKARGVHEEHCNVYNFPKGVAMAEPYMYEDMATAEQLKADGLEDRVQEKQLYRTVNPEGTIDHVVVAPGVAPAKIQQTFGTLGVGDDPKDMYLGNGFNISLYQGEYKVPSGERVDRNQSNHIITLWGDIPEDMIYRGNKSNDVVRKLVRSRILRGKQANKLLFYPDMKNARNLGVHEIDAAGGSIIVVVRTFDKQEYNLNPKALRSMAEMEFNYGDLQFEGKGGLLKRARRIQGIVATQLRIKGLNPANHAAIRAKSESSMEIRLIFETTGKMGTKRVKDVELLVPTYLLEKSQESQTVPLVSSSIPFTIDPTDLDAVTAAVMSWQNLITERAETAGAEDQGKLNSLYETFDALKAHQAALEDYKREHGATEDFHCDADVHSMINTVRAELWQEIGIRWRRKAAFDKDWYKKWKTRNLRSIETYINNFSVEFGETRAQRLKSRIFGKRRKYYGRLRAIEKILSERADEEINRLGVTNLRAQEQSEYLQKIQGLEDQVQSILRDLKAK